VAGGIPYPNPPTPCAAGEASQRYTARDRDRVAAAEPGSDLTREPPGALCEYKGEKAT
jgi:hypothetical protein